MAPEPDLQGRYERVVMAFGVVPGDPFFRAIGIDDHSKPSLIILTDTMITKTEEAVVSFIALGIGLWLALSQPEKWKALTNIVTRKWLLNFTAVIAFSLWVAIVERKNTQMLTSVKRGIMSLIIAIFGEVGLTIAPFWTIFAVSYFMESWI